MVSGIDEAGRGSLAGPVVAASVVIRNWSFREKIDDSKRLSRFERRRAFYEILARSYVGLGVIPEEAIDRDNIYQATIRAMEAAVRNLTIRPRYLLIDGRLTLNLPQKQIAVCGGDGKVFSIACASIVAKVFRDDLMECWERHYPEYGFSRHKGYGTREHFRAIARYGPCAIHRRSFRGVIRDS